MAPARAERPRAGAPAAGVAFSRTRAGCVGLLLWVTPAMLVALHRPVRNDPRFRSLRGDRAYSSQSQPSVPPGRAFLGIAGLPRGLCRHRPDERRPERALPHWLVLHARPLRSGVAEPQSAHARRPRAAGLWPLSVPGGPGCPARARPG